MPKRFFFPHLVSLFLSLSALVLSGCGAHPLNAQPPAASQTQFQKTTNREIAAQIQKMTLEEKVAQLFFVTPEDLANVKTVTQTGGIMKAALDKYPVGGLIFFKQNLTGTQQTKTMLKNMQEYAARRRGIPLFLGVDEEGGTIARIANNPAFNVHKVAPMGKLAHGKYPQAKVLGAASQIGAYLKDLGFNVDFAPDADVITTDKAS
ncbi:MAG: hypothetical protein IKX21_01505, partial [Deltaproteobacteria bacterium]|nr:hypothetical protein [Deltaproteobacteria bacterium]